MKHNNSMSELGEQIDNLNGSKMKGEKDKSNLERDLGDARASLEDTIKAKSDVDKQAKLLQGSIVDANNRLDDLARSLNDAESSKKRLRARSSSLLLASTMDPCRSLACLSTSDLALMVSSREALASPRSLSRLLLSFSPFILLPLRLSICSPNSDMLLLCFMRRAARVLSWPMFSCSSSPLILASSASLFLLSST